jgi:hypothetical protein
MNSKILQGQSELCAAYSNHIDKGIKIQRGAKAAFKKALVKGSLWGGYNHITEKNLGIREVATVQTNAVSFKTERGESWIRFDDKSASYRTYGYGQFQIFDDNKLVLTYTLQLNPKEAA